MTTLYKLSGKAIETLKFIGGGGPTQTTGSILPGIMTTFLDRLANPSPTHHSFRAPFIRPLLNKNASKQPIFNLLTPAIAPRPQDLEPDSPEQARLIEFFEEQRNNLLRNTAIDENLLPSVYCVHKKDLIGPPKLLVNEKYNIALTNASKHVAIPHAISVISHQLSLMLQALADKSFTVKLSRKPFPDGDVSDGVLDIEKRATFTDFQIERRNGLWHLVGVFQPLPSNPDPNGIVFQPAAPYSDALNYQPRKLTHSKTTRFAVGWEGDNWLEKSSLDFFSEQDTEPFDVPDEESLAADSQSRKRSRTARRTTYFASPMTQTELMGVQNEKASLSMDGPPQPRSRPYMRSRPSYSRTENEEEDLNTAEWDAIESDRRHSQWVDRLSSRDLLGSTPTVRDRKPSKVRSTKIPAEQSENPWAPPKERKPMRAWGTSNSNSSTETNINPQSKNPPIWGKSLPKMSDVRSTRPKEIQISEDELQKADTSRIARQRKGLPKFEREDAPHPGRRPKF